MSDYDFYVPGQRRGEDPLIYLRDTILRRTLDEDDRLIDAEFHRQRILGRLAIAHQPGTPEFVGSVIAYYITKLGMDRDAAEQLFREAWPEWAFLVPEPPDASWEEGEFEFDELDETWLDRLYDHHPNAYLAVKVALAYVPPLIGALTARAVLRWWRRR